MVNYHYVDGNTLIDDIKKIKYYLDVRLNSGYSRPLFFCAMIYLRQIKKRFRSDGYD